jgi:protein-tyrosine phosphatase
VSRNRTVLFVCHGNLCRSPLAEYLARAALRTHRDPAAANLTVASAGTHAVPDRSMHPHALSVLADRGLDGVPFRSRTLTPQLVETSDLVLTATRAQRGLCVEAAPARVGRVFALRHLGRLAALVEPQRLTEIPPDGRWSAMLRAITVARESLQPVAPEDDDLPDPYGLDVSAFRDTADAAEAALASILRLIVTA